MGDGDAKPLTRWGEKLGAPRVVANRLNHFGPVLSHAVDVPARLTILSPGTVPTMIFEPPPDAASTERLKTGAGLSVAQFTPSARRVPRPTGSGALASCRRPIANPCHARRNNRAEFKMNVSSEPTWMSAAMIGAKTPRNANAIPSVSTAMVPQKLNMITR